MQTTIGKDTIRRKHRIAFPDYADEFNCEFDDLPLIIRDGHEYGHINVMATIRWGRDRSWFVGEIFFSGWRDATEQERAEARRLGKYDSPNTQIYTRLDEGDPAYYVILDRIEDYYGDYVAGLIMEKNYDYECGGV